MFCDIDLISQCLILLYRFNFRTMPIHCSIPIVPISKDEFRTLDYKVMKHAFECHNSMGSLADERVYQADFAVRLRDAGFHVDREVPILLSHKSFKKALYVDHLINRKAAYELKVAKDISAAHRGQLLTYLYLLNMERGKLINFATQKVESEFINAAMTYDERRLFSVAFSGYHGPDSFANLVVEIVRDWGTSLSTYLYVEAVTGLLGPISRNGNKLAHQRFRLMTPEDAFQITTIATTGTGYRSHLERLLRFSPLKRLHWINIDRHQIQFDTVQN
jgi:GxxExxY protein